MSANDNPRKIIGVPALTSGVTLANGGVFPCQQIHTKPLTIVKHRVDVSNLIYALTAAPTGGAADGQGQKIMTLPQGKWLVLASRVDISTITPTGYTGTTCVYSIGTVTGVDGDAALTTTEADVLPSQTLGTGTVAAATANVDQVYTLGTGTAPALVGSTTADTDLYLNIAGNWIHATLTACTVTVTGTIELTLLDLGDI